MRALEEIRAVGRGQGLLVLDEPTVFLPREGVERLFALVREAAAAGRERSSSSRTTSTRCARSPTASRSCATARVVGTGRRPPTTSETQFVEMIIGRQLAALADVEHADLTGQQVGVSRRGA